MENTRQPRFLATTKGSKYCRLSFFAVLLLVSSLAFYCLDTLKLQASLAFDSAHDLVHQHWPEVIDDAEPTPDTATVTIVFASLQEQDTDWIETGLPDWKVARYIVDSENATYSVPENKGNEGMPYLTYIIDHYDELSPYTIFHHADRFQWHTDDRAYDGLRQLQRLNLDYVQEQGYVNLRCDWKYSCSEWEDEAETTLTSPSEDVADAYKYIFEAADDNVLDEINEPCCAEFAVADWTIRSTPRDVFVRAREWLLDTELTDDLSGRVMERIWHCKFFKKTDNRS